jgi:hypothetical protein
MIALFWFVFGAGLASLTIAAGVTLRQRRIAAFQRRPVVDDRVVEQIIREGKVWLDDDEPLDLEEIDYEEERFWSERWDEPSNDW